MGLLQVKDLLTSIIKLNVKLILNPSLQLQYDRQVGVTFQENAWCDETVMMSCTGRLFATIIYVLVLDVHRAQKAMKSRSS